MRTSVAKEYQISIPRSMASKKKQTAQRSARISNLPIDILNKVHDKQNIINSIQFDPPHFSPSSVPVSICNSPQSSNQNINEHESNEKPTFMNYFEQIPKMNSNTIIINDMPKDINEVIRVIIDFVI
ncbi:hypothetical protein TVAG_363120 [Trichomonas vaginalis G3]|uniref:Uncharacterized protein n=1 Tax=Trichomonas vaginalis (strain ATCC PRA-98 / G3) TaxID=412133 RepID=A2FQH4_TRIV3|nr:hypothetical protein TVAG_363120 [Trichomonas vaginalis G3]|eukprot:XP_001305765.1 hypothetical protein [Trichomonas vaginalis G3]